MDQEDLQIAHMLMALLHLATDSSRYKLAKGIYKIFIEYYPADDASIMQDNLRRIDALIAKQDARLS